MPFLAYCTATAPVMLQLQQPLMTPQLQLQVLRQLLPRLQQQAAGGSGTPASSTKQLRTSSCSQTRR
jgi:hypothetical protein